MDNDDLLARRGPRRWRELLRFRYLPVWLWLAVFSVPLLDQQEHPKPWPCPPQPTAVLPFDPADGAQLAARATDIFVGRVVGGAAGPDPASPVPGALPDVPVSHLLVEVIEARKGTATGTVVVHQALQPVADECHRGIVGDYPLWTGDVRLFVVTRDEPTGTYSLFAGPYSHPFADAVLGAAPFRITPYVTVPPAIPSATAAP